MIRIQVLERFVLQDAGRERPIDPGMVLELPPTVAESYVRAGCAVLLEETATLPSAPENKSAPLGRRRRVS